MKLVNLRAHLDTQQKAVTHHSCSNNSSNLKLEVIFVSNQLKLVNKRTLPPFEQPLPERDLLASPC